MPSVDVPGRVIPVASSRLPAVWDPAPSNDGEWPATGGTRFRAYLELELRRRNWTQRQLAARSGVDHSTISRILTQTRSPRLETVERLRDALRGETLRARREWADLPSAVRTISAILAGDPRMDPQRVNEVIEFYVAARARRQQPPVLTPTPTIRRVSARPESLAR